MKSSNFIVISYRISAWQNETRRRMGQPSGRIKPAIEGDGNVICAVGGPGHRINQGDKRARVNSRPAASSSVGGSVYSGTGIRQDVTGQESGRRGFEFLPPHGQKEVEQAGETTCPGSWAFSLR